MKQKDSLKKLREDVEEDWGFRSRRENILLGWVITAFIALIALTIFTSVIDNCDLNCTLEKSNLSLNCEEYEQVDEIQMKYNCHEYVQRGYFSICKNSTTEKVVAQVNGDCIKWEIVRGG